MRANRTRGRGVRGMRSMTGFGAEAGVRGLVQRGIQRGRVEVTVSRENQGGRSRAVRADLALAREYLAATRQLKRALRMRGEVTLQQLLAFPEIVRLEETREDAEGLWGDLENIVGAALDGLLRMRAEEGGRLAADTGERLARVEALLGQGVERGVQVVGEYTVRLRQRLAELLGEVPLDEARLAAELALFAERSDITEELTRLGRHLSPFRVTLTGGG